MKLMLSAVLETLALGIMHLALGVLLWLFIGPFYFHNRTLNSHHFCNLLCGRCSGDLEYICTWKFTTDLLTGKLCLSQKRQCSFWPPGGIRMVAKIGTWVVGTSWMWRTEDSQDLAWGSTSPRGLAEEGRGRESPGRRALLSKN